MTTYKKSLLFILFFIASTNSKAQVKLEYLEVLSSTSKISYVGLRYTSDEHLFTPDFNMIANALEIMQRRYDAAFDLISHEYRKLKELKLLNIRNVELLKSHQSQVDTWMKSNLHNADLSKPNISKSILDYITSIYSITSIANEIKILQGLDQVYFSALQSFPTHKNINCLTIVEKDVSGALKKIESCNEYELSKSPDIFFRDFLKDKAKRRVLSSDSTYNAITLKYKYLTNFKTIPNGWNDAYIVSIQKASFFDGVFGFTTLSTKVYVSNNKVTMFTNGFGNIENVIQSSTIQKQLADIVVKSESCNGISQNTPFYVYFLNP